MRIESKEELRNLCEIIYQQVGSIGNNVFIGIVSDEIIEEVKSDLDNESYAATIDVCEFNWEGIKCVVKRKGI